MTPGPADRTDRPGDGRRGRPTATWLPAQVDAEFAAIVSRVADTAAPLDRLPAAERLPEQSTGAAPGVDEQAGRIASALFCTGRLDPSFVAFTIHRTAEHGRIGTDEVLDLIAARVLAIAAELIATPSGPAADISSPAPTGGPHVVRPAARRSGGGCGRLADDVRAPDAAESVSRPCGETRPPVSPGALAGSGD